MASLHITYDVGNHITSNPLFFTRIRFSGQSTNRIIEFKEINNVAFMLG